MSTAHNVKMGPWSAALATLIESDQGSLLAAQVHKVGVARGPKGHKVIYDDDQVYVLIWTGFTYADLIARSKKMLDQHLNKGGSIKHLAQKTLAIAPGATIADVCEAIQETQDWFRRVLSSPGQYDPGAIRERSSVWEPLYIEGVRVRGCRVYRGPDRPEDPRAPVPGTIYLQGVKLGEKVLTPAANGSWRPDSKPKTLAKQILKADLPVGLYCQYRMDPERVSTLAVGKDAARVASAAQISIDPIHLQTLFRIAP